MRILDVQKKSFRSLQWSAQNLAFVDENESPLLQFKNTSSKHLPNRLESHQKTTDEESKLLVIRRYIIFPEFTAS